MQSSDSFFVVLATRFHKISCWKYGYHGRHQLFSMNLRVYYVISKHIGLIDVQGACENATPLLCPCFHRPSESIAIILYQSSSVTGTRHVEIRQSTNPRNQHGNLKADHSTAISNRNLLFKEVHVSIDWRSSRSPRILPAHPVQCARTEG